MNEASDRLTTNLRVDADARHRKPLGQSLALGLSSAFLMTSSPVGAQEVVNMETLSIEDRAIDANPYAEPGAPYKARVSGDARHTRPLAETPATISVLTKKQIEDAGQTDLRAILDAQPGITLGTGENGNAFGDRYIIRGQEARSDVFVDGMRDPGMTIRESFATEQVEISKGPNSSFAGRGTSGGAVNSVTKQASTDYDFTNLSTGLGTGRHTRVTLDANHVFNQSAALRLNLLHAYEEVPGRSPADRERQGLALSGLLKPHETIDVMVDYYGMRADDRPDLGSYLVGSLPNRIPAPDVPVYAQQADFLKSEVDTVTGRVRARLTPSLRLENQTRYGASYNAYVATGARGITTAPGDPDGAYDTATLSTHNGWQDVEYLANHTNLFVDKVIGGRKHELNFGVEVSSHKVVNGVHDIDNTGSTNCLVPGRGAAPATGGYCLSGPDGRPVNGLNTLLGREIAVGRWDQDWQARTVSVSAMDTVDLTDRWTAFGGVRYDRTRIDLVTRSASGLDSKYAYSDGMWNYHLGATYRFRPAANVYFSYATASDVNGGESDVGTSSGYGGLVTFNGQVAGARPERTENIELGTKWNLADGKLLASAAVFNITKRDVMEGADYDSAGTFNTGSNRVRGLEFGLAGNATPKLSFFAGITLMKAEVLGSAVSANIGKTLSNFADRSAAVQVRYQVTPKLAVGTTARYESKRFAGQPDSAPGYDPDGGYTQPVPSYTVFDLFASYEISKQATVRLNIGNATNKDYYLAAYRSGAFVYKGDARNARLTLSYAF